MEFKPSLSKKGIEKRREFHEWVYQTLKANKNGITVRVLGKDFFALPGMFLPFPSDSVLLAGAVKKEVAKGDSVLDLGTGSGIHAIFSAAKAARVTASDINPKAVKCARLNAKHHSLETKIKVVQSDLFEKINGKFDLIIFNPPFRWFKPRDILEMSVADENYQTLSRFFSEVKNYLTAKGRVLIVFTTNGDKKYLEELIRKENFRKELVAEKRKFGWRYFVYRLTIKSKTSSLM